VTPFSDQERTVIEKLLVEIDDLITDMTTVLGSGEEPAVLDVRTAQAWLRGFRDTGRWCAPHGSGL